MFVGLIFYYADVPSGARSGRLRILRPLSLITLNKCDVLASMYWPTRDHVVVITTLTKMFGDVRHG